MILGPFFFSKFFGGSVAVTANSIVVVRVIAVVKEKTAAIIEVTESLITIIVSDSSNYPSY